MQYSLRTLVVAAATAAIAAGTAVAQSGGGSGEHSKQMHENMMSGMQKMQQLPMTGNTDKDFATMMRHHHMQGIEMAKMEVAHGKSPEMKRMAQKTIKEQQKEIAEFDKWLSKQK